METQIMDEKSVDQLASKARAAYEQKRTRDCIALSATILRMDPHHEEAKNLLAAIHSQIERDLNDARTLLQDADGNDNGQKYRKAAEIILLKTLNLDPGNEEAKALLAQAKALSEPAPHAVAATPAAPVAAPPTPPVAPSAPAAVAAAVTKAAPEMRPSPIKQDLRFTATPFEKPVSKAARKGPTSVSRLIPFVLGAVVLLGAGWLLLRPEPAVSGSAAANSESSPAVADGVSKEQAPEPVPTPAPAIAPAVAAATPNTTTPAPATNTTETPAAVAPVEVGTLAVSSLVATDIYQGDKLLGSTPTTLQLPVGRQTLEYRHGNLRTVVNHNIKAKETTTALIPFETVVQINARPWAQVFVEGTTKRPLGQTPLSDIRVPIGSVLAFENPNFPSKTYRVTEQETAIQVVFP